MKKILSTFTATAFFAMVCVAANIKVACVGDSITYGSGIKDREQNSYPVQLGKILGDGYEVKNFGVGAATLLSKGNKPYIETYAYIPALKFNPNIVIIKLGTNDSKPFNWCYGNEFESDLNKLIDSFEQLSSNPIIYLCRQVPAYEDKWGITDSVVVNKIFPIVEKVAKERGIKIIDMRTPLENKEAIFPDKIHPNVEGAKIMAETAAKIIRKQN